jgi:invasion protein IalB
MTTARLKKYAWLAAFAMTAPVAAQSAAARPGGAGSQETFGSWTVVCKEAIKLCSLSQTQTDPQSRQRVLTLQLSPVDDKVNGTLIMPFGLALDNGVTLQVDDGPAGPVLRYRTCLPLGCLVSISFDAKLVAALRKGAALRINGVADGGKAETFTIPLDGFPAALDRTLALVK